MKKDDKEREREIKKARENTVKSIDKIMDPKGKSEDAFLQPMLRNFQIQLYRQMSRGIAMSQSSLTCLTFLTSRSGQMILTAYTARRQTCRQ